MAKKRHLPLVYVWVQTTDGPKGQMWADLAYGERCHERPYVLAVHPLTEEEATLRVDELAKRFPLFPEVEGGVDD